MVDVVAEVETQREGAVLTITLNRPEVLNALGAAAHVELAAALEEARDPEIRAVVLTGSGSGFCVGQDLQELRSTARTIADQLRERYHPHVLAIRSLEKPVLASVNGAAAGAGLSLALACDARVASDAASFVPGFIGVGLAPDSGATWLVRRTVGASRAFEWLTTGRRLTAAEALQWGIVSEVVPAEQLAARTAEVAELFAAMPTQAVWQTKRLLDGAETATLQEQLESEARTQADLAKTPDFTEGLAAFLEKREARFTGAPPEQEHPVRLVVHDDLRRWRLTVFFRYLLLAIPHLIVATGWLLLVGVVAIPMWVIALIRGRVPQGLHEWTARALRYWTHVQAYTFLIADPFPGFRGWPGTYPVDLAVGPRERQPRWQIALRLLLAVPAYFLGYVLNVVMQVTALIGWFAAIALGRMPRGMRDLMAYCLRYQAQTYAYLLLLTSRYPSLASGSGFQFEEARDVRSDGPQRP
jgi:2-(1,2-epoxy-1,2-dihydrophenyl)acetyl-CoA isomerase